MNNEPFIILFQNEKNSLSVANLNVRTTSSLESFHRSLNRSMAKHGTFYVFLEGLKLNESDKSNNMYNLIHNNLPESHLQRRHAEDQKREEYIRQFSADLKNGNLTTMTFLEAMAKCEPCMFSLNSLEHCIHLFQIWFTQDIVDDYNDDNSDVEDMSTDDSFDEETDSQDEKWALSTLKWVLMIIWIKCMTFLSANLVY